MFRVVLLLECRSNSFRTFEWTIEAVAILNCSSSGEPMCLKHLYFICERFRENAAVRPHCQCFAEYGPFGVTLHTYVITTAQRIGYNRPCVSAVVGIFSTTLLQMLTHCERHYRSLSNLLTVAYMYATLQNSFT